MPLEHRITGNGPTVVLLHGVCHRGHAWDAVVPLLADRYRVVVVDLPGHGSSPGVPDDVDPVGYSVEQLAELLRDITPDGELPHLAGNSLGGFAALELGARGLAASVTAFSPAGFFRSDLDRRHAVQVFRTLRALARTAAPLVPGLSQRAAGRALFMGAFCVRPWRYPAEAVAMDADAIVTNRIVDRGLVADFTYSEPVDEDLPISVVWGRFDLVLPVGQRALVPRVFPRALVEVAPNGHVPMTDDPEGVAATITATIARGIAHAR